MEEIEIHYEDEYKKFQKLKEKWNNVKNNEQISFPEYVDSLIEEFEELLKTEDFIEDIKTVKLYSFNNMLSLKYLIGGVSLTDIIYDSSSGEKIKYFIQFNNQLTDEKYWEYLAYVYQQQDYNPVPYGILKALFTNERAGKENLMNNDERQLLKSLPNSITIYRAMSEEEFESREFRFSWTLNEEVVEKFKERNSMLYSEKQIVHEIEISKSDVLAYLNDRNEEEIIYMSK